jgi:Winged helix DNA-binding domain
VTGCTRFEGWLEKRGGLEIARGMLDDAVEILTEAPRDRATLLAALAERGHRNLGPYAVNVVVPWMTTQGVVVGLPDGRLRAADRPRPIDEDEALARMARRYLAGYGPATAADLAYWSGLPLGAARRGFAAAERLESAGDELLALPGTLDREPPPEPQLRLLAGFDTLMLGWRSREVWLRTEHDRRLLPGSGVVRPTALVRGAVKGTWRMAGSGPTRKLEIEWFGRPAAAAAIRAEADDIARFLGLSRLAA